MAGETLYSNLVTLAAYIDAGVLEVLRTRNVMLNLMYTVNLPPGSNSKTLRARNAQTASVVSEATEATAAVYSISAGNTLVAKKAVVLNELSEEAQLFGGLELGEVREEQGAAISEKVDTDACGLFTGFSQSASATGAPLTVSKLVEADYKAGLSFAPNAPVFVLGNVQVYHIKDNIVTAGASVWANPTVNNLLDAAANPQNGLVGLIFGRAVYMTQHVPTSGPDRVGACIVPGYALAAAVVRPPDTLLEPNISKRTIEVSTDYYYDVKERNDLSGCRILSSAT